MKKLPVAFARQLLTLEKGGELPGSRMNKTRLQELEREGIVIIQRFGRTKTRVRIDSMDRLTNFLRNVYGIEDLKAYVDLFKQESVSGRRAQMIAGNTKLRTDRTFKGFLVNVNTPLAARLHGKEIILQPQPGTFTFIYDYEKFQLDPDVVIVGMENPENFRFIELQKHLFPKGDKLFVSRYPQNSDLIIWLKNIPNPYLHFGDFDLAGISIFISEYANKLGKRASFFIPDDIEKRIQRKGNRDLYNVQYDRYKNLESGDARLQTLIDIIHKHKRGLEQEVLIGE